MASAKYHCCSTNSFRETDLNEKKNNNKKKNKKKTT